MGSKAEGQEVLQYPTITVDPNNGGGAPHAKEGAMVGKTVGKVVGFIVAKVGSSETGVFEGLALFGQHTGERTGHVLVT